MIERFFPNEYVKKVSDIDINNLLKNGIKGVLVDIDNTLIDYYENISEETCKWIKDVKKAGILFYLLSNNNKDRVDKVSSRLNVKGIYHAKKPRRYGIIAAMKEMNLKNNEVAIIGDQVFTDVYGGNRLNIYTILVEQINKKDIWITVWKRPFERHIVKKYLMNTNSRKIKKRDLWKVSSAIKKKIQLQTVK